MGLISSGAPLMADPTGGGLGFTSDIVEKVLFHSFLPVELFLFLIYGRLSDPHLRCADQERDDLRKGQQEGRITIGVGSEE